MGSGVRLPMATSGAVAHSTNDWKGAHVRVKYKTNRTLWQHLYYAQRRARCEYRSYRVQHPQASRLCALGSACRWALVF